MAISAPACLERKKGRVNVQPLWGAGLLAKTVCQLSFMLPGTPLSRANPFPQGLRFGLLGQCVQDLMCGFDPFRNRVVFVGQDHDADVFGRHERDVGPEAAG